MINYAQFTPDDADLIRSLTGLSVEKALLQHVAKKLNSQFADALEPNVAAVAMMKRLLNLLDKKDQVRLCTLLALARKAEQEGPWQNASELELRDTSEIVDLNYKWLSPKPSLRVKLQEALGYGSRSAFLSLCRSVGVTARSSGKTYSNEEVLKLLRGKLATLPWWEARLIARLIAGRKRSKRDRIKLADDLGPPRPAAAFAPRIRSRRPKG